MFNRSGKYLNDGKITYHLLSLNDGKKYLNEFEINLDNPDSKIYLCKINKVKYGPFTIIGKEFKFAVGMCNGGKVFYKFV